jgi:flagellar motility protein MotE (MotC chaperone)
MQPWMWYALGALAIGAAGFAWLKGMKPLAIIGAIGAGFAVFKGVLRRAEKKGAETERERQRQEAEDAIRRGNEAEEAERERQRREGPGTHPPDAPWIVNRKPGGLPDDSGGH